MSSERESTFLKTVGQIQVRHWQAVVSEKGVFISPSSLGLPRCGEGKFFLCPEFVMHLLKIHIYVTTSTYRHISVFISPLSLYIYVYIYLAVYMYVLNVCKYYNV